jgi:hypothetical protein
MLGAIESIPSHNGRGSHAWYGSWTQFSVDRRSAAYCRVTFERQAITDTSVAELGELLDLIEQDSDLEVVVFDSPQPDLWPDLLARLSRAQVVSVEIAARLVDSGRHEL